MNLQLKKTAVACAMAFAAGGAHALGPFDAPDLTIYLSGASAPQNFLGALSGQLFQGVKGTDWFEYFDDAGSLGTFNSSDGANYRAYFGVLKLNSVDSNIPVAIEGKKVLLVNRAKNGSVWGVNPLARNEGIAYMPVNAGNCQLAVPQQVGTTTVTFTPTYNYACSQAGNDLVPSAPGNVIPDFGVSDLEPKMFKDDRNVEFGVTQLTDDEAGNITNFGVSALMFGLPATANVTGTISSIPAAMFGGMLSGTIKTWDKVNAAFSTNKDVMVCRRFQGSGTQASYNQFFNGFPCNTGALGGNGSVATSRIFDSVGFASSSIGDGSGSSDANAIIIDASTGYTVIENSSSGNVRSCLINAQSGTDFFFTHDDGTHYLVKFGGTTATSNPNLFTGGASRKSIGVLSLDSKGNTGNPASWDFLQLNDVAPTQANMVSLKYPFSYELSMQYRTGALNPLSGLKKTFADMFIKRAGDPLVLNAITSQNVKDSVAAVPIAYSVTASKVMAGTRFGNSCQPIQPQP